MICDSTNTMNVSASSLSQYAPDSIESGLTDLFMS